MGIAINKSFPGLLLCLLHLLFLSSCKEVSFPQPQPAGISALKEVPAALRGEYKAGDAQNPDADALIIESWGYHFRDGKDNDWLGKGVLSDSLVVKFYQNYYFVNFRSGTQWVLRLIRQKPSGALEFLSIDLSDDEKTREMLKKLSKKTSVKEVHGNEETYYQINPSRDQLMQLIREGYFTGAELTRIK